MAKKKNYYPRFKSGLLVHRHVASKMLGRKLRPGEEVHHKDRNTRNFSADNLQVFPNRAAHRRHHRKRGLLGFLKSLFG